MEDNHNPNQGCDLSRVQAVAQTRYMDKQRVSQSSEWEGIPYAYPTQTSQRNTQKNLNNQVDFQSDAALLSFLDRKESNLKECSNEKDKVSQQTFVKEVIQKVFQNPKNISTCCEKTCQATQKDLNQNTELGFKQINLRDEIFNLLPKIFQNHRFGMKSEADEQLCKKLHSKLLCYFISKECSSDSPISQKSEVSYSNETQIFNKQENQVSLDSETAEESQQAKFNAISKSSLEIENFCKNDISISQEKGDQISKKDDEDNLEEEEEDLMMKPSVMIITKCPHTERKHYAKNMCSSCYRKFGRNQFASKCGHTDRLLYSMGMCQTCYLADYHQRRTKLKKRLAKNQQKMVDLNSASCESISKESINRINTEIEKAN